ncbi:hypothetical protein ACHAW5_001155 [Stephanodiscus triporus]|uniref:Uncharacterized protein n=1 Tax=Stephanodiscus triporus TaxID=2934178 RepID=A0ABD3MR48_9STRA
MSNNYQLGGQGDGRGDDDDDRSASSIGMATCDENFTADHRQFNDAIQGGVGIDDDDDVGVGDDYRIEEAAEDVDDAATTEATNAVESDRAMTHKENVRKLQSILESIKNSTKNILGEMDTYLKETAEVEKAYIRCRANTQKESRRMERVEPDVIAATQRFMAQGAQLFGGGGCVNFANMAALLGGGGGGDSTGRPSATTARNIADDAAAAFARTGTVTPRGNDGASRAGSMASSSMAGSVS